MDVHMILKRIECDKRVWSKKMWPTQDWALSIPGFLNWDPEFPLEATEQFWLSLISSAMILQNLSVTILIICQLKGEGGHKPRNIENH